MSLLRAVLLLSLFVVTCAISGWKLMNQKKAEPMLGRNGPFGERRSGSHTESELKRIEAIPNSEFGVAGSLSIYLMREPSFEAFSKGVTGEDRYLDVWFDGDEWAALYFDVLGCPTAESIPRTPNEDREHWEQRYSSAFQRAIPEYPMLGRISDLFLYVTYNAQEIEQLRNECVKIQFGTSNQRALKGLSTLIDVCDEALKVNSGLLLAPQ